MHSFYWKNGNLIHGGHHDIIPVKKHESDHNGESPRDLIVGEQIVAV